MNWITEVLAKVTRFKTTQMDSLLSDHSVDRSHPRYHEDPSSGRGSSKRVILCSNSNSDSAQPPPRRASQKERSK